MAPTVLVTGYNVRGTVRSKQTAVNVRKTHTKFAEQLSFAIVPDISILGAFDEAVKDVDGVIHTASPFIFDAKDVQKELYKPAIQGTISILEAVQKFNSRVSRVVVISSFASALDLTEGARPHYRYTKADWNPVVGDDAAKNPILAYLASKTMAEKAAFDFVRDNKLNFTVTTLLPPLIYGPVKHHVPERKALGTSAADILRLFNGSKMSVPKTDFYAFIDVRDVAQAHVRAYKTKKAAEQRYLTASLAYSYQNIVDIIRDKFPEFKDTTLEGEKGAPIPPCYTLDTAKIQEELGITFRPLEESIVDTVNSLKLIPE